MESLDLTGPLLIGAACLAAAPALGISLAYARSFGRSWAWHALDPLLLLPAFFPARALASVLENFTGERFGDLYEFWPILAGVIVSTPFAYLPARLAFTRRHAPDPRPAFRRGLALLPLLLVGTLLAIARMLGEFGSELFADGPLLVLIAAPTLVAAILITIHLARDRTE